MTPVSKVLLFSLGWLCVGLGAVGVFLPLLPTTPFLLVAAWAFARTSPRFRNWLVSHRVFGRYVSDWQEQGAIPMHGKILAIGMMSASLIWVVGWSGLSAWITGAIALCLFAVAAFIITRPTAIRRLD